MPKMRWHKAPQELVEIFESVVPGPLAEQCKMFGERLGDCAIFRLNGYESHIGLILDSP